MIRQGIYDMKQLQELDRVREFIAKKYSPDKFRMYDQIRDFPTSATEIKKFKPESFQKGDILDIKRSKIDCIKLNSSWNDN